MQEVTTIPGKTYAVECAGEVVITNNETGAIAAQGDGSGQVLFTACSNSYSVSDDTAKVVALFKLAPRLKLTLLQGVAGGVLPEGFTELEYLESSGTQYLRLPALNITSDDSVNLDFSVSAYSGAAADGVFSAYKFGSGEYLRAFLTNPTSGLTLAFAWGGGTIGGTKISLNEKLAVLFSGSKIELNGTQVATPQVVTFSYSDFVLCTQRALNQYWHSLIKLFSFAVPGKCRLIPALRNADGVAGMWDAVSKQFFTNAGTGVFGYRVKGAPAAFSLRDPHRVAPSGVWAKLKAANELDIIADTELDDGEPLGYTWHSNVGEAYDAYGIVIQDELN